MVLAPASPPSQTVGKKEDAPVFRFVHVWLHSLPSSVLELLTGFNVDQKQDCLAYISAPLCTAPFVGNQLEYWQGESEWKICRAFSHLSL
jgi:hypothetical protein